MNRKVIAHALTLQGKVSAADKTADGYSTTAISRPSNSTAVPERCPIRFLDKALRVG